MKVGGRPEGRASSASSSPEKRRGIGAEVYYLFAHGSDGSPASPSSLFPNPITLLFNWGVEVTHKPPGWHHHKAVRDSAQEMHTECISTPSV